MLLVIFFFSLCPHIQVTGSGEPSGPNVEIKFWRGVVWIFWSTKPSYTPLKTLNVASYCVLWSELLVFFLLLEARAAMRPFPTENDFQKVWLIFLRGISWCAFILTPTLVWYLWGGNYREKLPPRAGECSGAGERRRGPQLTYVN